MSYLQFTNPPNNAKFESKIPVTFTGKADQGIVTIKLKADDKWDLGSDRIDANGFWSITYSGFTETGDRKITAIGFAQGNQNKGETSIHINIAESPLANDYTKTIYDGLVLDAYKNLEHALKTPVDRGLSEEDGRKLFEAGILQVLRSVDTFMEATAEGRQELDLHPGRTDIKKASCAYSVSCVMKYIAKKLELKEVQQLFEKTFETDCVQVTGVEKKLRRLGFIYYLKKDYLAPRGAIGALAGRHPYQGTLHGSDHTYFITKDGSKRTEFPNPDQGNLQDLQEGNPEKGIDGAKWKIKDLHAENLHFFDHVFHQWTNGYTEGFWLPPGVYPLKRS
jgi:hypothetical protein